MFAYEASQDAAAVKVVAVATSLWAVYDRAEEGVALGHVDLTDGRFHVGLEGAELEAFTFATLGDAVEWILGASSIGNSAAADGIGAAERPNALRSISARLLWSSS